VGDDYLLVLLEALSGGFVFPQAVILKSASSDSSVGSSSEN
jgi:hypothetical protein